MAIIQTPDGRFFNIPKEKANEVADKLKEFELSAEEIEAEINKMTKAHASRPTPAPRTLASGGATIVNIFCSDGPPAISQGQGDVEGYEFDWSDPNNRRYIEGTTKAVFRIIADELANDLWK